MDTLTPKQRRKCMSAIRAKDTKPERVVRRIVHGLGFRFRLHATDLPGKPDLVFRSRHAVIFVHGCYWHLHHCKRGQSTPRTNALYWRKKRQSNRQRDRRALNNLRRDGWRVLVLWECQIGNATQMAERILRLLK